MIITIRAGSSPVSRTINRTLKTFGFLIVQKNPNIAVQNTRKMFGYLNTFSHQKTRGATKEPRGSHGNQSNDSISGCNKDLTSYADSLFSDADWPVVNISFMWLLIILLTSARLPAMVC